MEKITAKEALDMFNKNKEKNLQKGIKELIFQFYRLLHDTIEKAQERKVYFQVHVSSETVSKLTQFLEYLQFKGFVVHPSSFDNIDAETSKLLWMTIEF